jgi:predicted RecB family nuclease
VRQQVIGKILARYPEGEVAIGITLTAAAMRKGPLFMLDTTLEDDQLSIGFDGLKRAAGGSKLGDFHYIPMLFQEGHRIRKEQRILLELYGLFLSELQGRQPELGIIWYGNGPRARKVRLSPDQSKTTRILGRVDKSRGL